MTIGLINTWNFHNSKVKQSKQKKNTRCCLCAFILLFEIRHMNSQRSLQSSWNIGCGSVSLLGLLPLITFRLLHHCECGQNLFVATCNEVVRVLRKIYSENLKQIESRSCSKPWGPEVCLLRRAHRHPGAAGKRGEFEDHRRELGRQSAHRDRCFSNVVCVAGRGLNRQEFQ